MDDIEDKPMQKSEPGTPLREETVGEAAERVALRKREERSLLWKIDLLREFRLLLVMHNLTTFSPLSRVRLVGAGPEEEGRGS